MENSLLAGVVLLALLPAPATATAVSPVPADDAAVDVQDVAVEITVERWNATAVAYHLSVAFPPGVRAGRVLPYSGRVVRADGFGVAGDARALVWNGTRTASMTLVSNVRRAAAAGCTCVATDDWVLAAPPRVQVSVRRGRRWSSAYLTDWLSESTVAADVTVRDGLFLPGVVFLGNVSVAKATTSSGERIRLVTPAAAADAIDEAAVLDALVSASSRLDVGPSPDATVTVVVVPDVEGHAAHVDEMDDRGRAVGHGYVYVDESTDATTWIHEYVHTRQTFTAAADMRWFVEATAEYYGHYLAAEREGAALDLVADRFGDADRSNRVLAAPETWDSRSVPYRQGGQVVAHLDRRIRAETGGERTFLDVFRRLNGREDVTVSALRNATAAVVGSRVLDGEIDRYVTTSASLDRPDGIVRLVEPTRAVSPVSPVHRRVVDTATERPRPWTVWIAPVVGLAVLVLLVVLRR